MYILRAAFAQILLCQRITKITAIREKLRKELLYKNGVHKMLMTLRPFFIKLIQVAFTRADP